MSCGMLFIPFLKKIDPPGLKALKSPGGLTRGIIKHTKLFVIITLQLLSNQQPFQESLSFSVLLLP